MSRWVRLCGSLCGNPTSVAVLRCRSSLRGQLHMSHTPDRDQWPSHGNLIIRCQLIFTYWLARRFKAFGLADDAASITEI